MNPVPTMAAQIGFDSYVFILGHEPSLDSWVLDLAKETLFLARLSASPKSICVR